MKQTTQTARMLVDDAAQEHHYQARWATRLRADHQRSLGRFEPLDDLPNYKARVLNPYNLEGRPANSRPTTSSARQLARFVQAAQTNDAARPAAEIARQAAALRRWSPMWAASTSSASRQEGVPVHPGRPVQAALPDGLPRRGRHSTSTTTVTADARRQGLGPPRRRPGRGRGHQLADGPDEQGDQQQPRHADHRGA